VPFYKGIKSVLGNCGIGIERSFSLSLFVYYFLKNPSKTIRIKGLKLNYLEFKILWGWR
jgi:hypothetical protein